METNKSPSRKTGELDNRGSHFYLALYWAEALAEQSDDADLQATFAPIAKALGEQENKIIEELTRIQGSPVDIGGYFQAESAKTKAVMRPSETFNSILAQLG